jgi:hypothetical protein
MNDPINKCGDRSSDAFCFEGIIVADAAVGAKNHLRTELRKWVTPKGEMKSVELTRGER